MHIQSLDSILKESQSGAKAFHLSKMKRAGLPVPAGFVINVSAFDYFFLNNVNMNKWMVLNMMNLLELNPIAALNKGQTTGITFD